MLKIVFNRQTTAGNKTGVGQYASNLLAALREAAAESGIDCFPKGLPWVACQAQARVNAALNLLRNRATRLQGLRWLGPLAHFAHAVGSKIRPWGRRWIRQHIRSVLERGGFDVYHEPNFIPVPTDVPTVVTVHDLSVLLNPEWHPAERIEDYRRHFLHGIRQSRHIITVSDSVRREVMRVLNLPAAKVTRVYNGVSSRYEPLPPQTTAAALRHWGLKPGYLLHLGTLEPRKNVTMLMRAYCSLPRPIRDRAPLLLVGSWGWQNRAIREYYHGHARHRGVRHLGYLPDRDLPALYNGARALVCPSHYEGFGLPCMEMLACGGAVLASTADVFKETLGGQALLISADDADAWRAALAEIINDENLRSLLRQGACARAMKFNWRNSAIETIDVYRKACGREQQTHDFQLRVA